MKKLLVFLLPFALLANLQSYAQCNALFTHVFNPSGNNLLNVDFTNNSTANNPNPAGTSYTTTTIYFGDGNASLINPNATIGHNYANAGTYTVIMQVNSYDSTINGSTLYCTDTTAQTFTIAYIACMASITTQNNGGGQYTFTANNPANTNGMAYIWNFGDGSATVTGTSVSHTFASSGSYFVYLNSIGGGCQSSDSSIVYYFPTGPFNCSSAIADFTSSTTNSDVHFSNLSTDNQGNNNIASIGTWNFGDGSTTTTSASGINHSYAAVGTYTVSLVNNWMDSSTNQAACSKTATQTIVINSLTPPSPPANQISGIVTFDTLSNMSWSDTIQVWLIIHDTTANTLTAVDSQYVSPYYAFYTFNNKPAGDYLVKGAFKGQTTGSTGYLSTYHLASVYWSTATNIAHSAGIDANKDIHLQNGTVTSGPGFVGGNISAGAGKGTGTGIPNLLVFLRDNTNKVITSTLTDVNGDYSFSNIPTGTYSVYPELINYGTTPYNSIAVTSAQAHVSAIDFEKTDSEILPKEHGTGISQITKEDGLNVYPNPAKNFVAIENQNGLFNHVKIINSVGQLIKEANLKTGINKVDITETNAGIYYLLISGNNGSRSVKFVKQ